jgi:predicted Rossmann fold nucleotide-binding protein DprA/Smf involved in DNA uptake
MNKILICGLAIGVFVISACNSGDNKTEAKQKDNLKKDTVQNVNSNDTKEIKTIPLLYANIDEKAAASIKEIIDHYLHIKNALTNDNGNDASKGAKEMSEAMKKLDKSLFTNEQKKTYDNIEDDLKEHAEHIGKNGDNIKHEREHFSMMSEDVFDLVKAFGGGRELYNDYCPMYNDNKGAIWLSETKEIRNPYFGEKMMTCGRVEGVLK